MSHQMERQKVLYVARTKTAKVIRPTSMKYPLPSTSPPETDTYQAPLASVDPELVVATRRGSATNKLLRGQVRKPASKTNVCNDQVVHSESGTFRQEHWHKELRDDTSTRTYVKQRSLNTLDIYQGNQNNVSNHKLNNVRPGQFLSCGLSTSEPKPQVDNGHVFASYDHSHTKQTRDSRNVPRDEVSRKATNNLRSVRRVDKKTQRNIQHGAVTIVNRNYVNSAEQKNITKTPPPVAPKPNRICTTSSEAVDSTLNITLSENDTRDSKPPFSQSQVVYQNGYLSSKKNCIDSSQALDKNILGMTQTGKEKVKSIYKPGRNSSQSPDQLLETSIQTKLQQEPTRDYSSYSSTLLPEMVEPVKVLLHNEDPLPEMYTTSVPLNAANTRPMAIRGIVTQSSEIFQHRNGPRQPLVAIDTSFNEPRRGIEEQSKHSRKSDSNTIDTQLSPDNDSQNKEFVVLNRKQSIDEGFTSISQTGQTPTESLDMFPVKEFRNSWNRTSMRLATHGYTSMSDLTNSLERLTDHQPEVPAYKSSLSPNTFVDNNQLRQTGVHAKTLCPNEGESENDDSALITSKHEKHNSDDLCHNDCEINEPHIDNELLKEISFEDEPVTLLERNGINRLSYRMATSSINDISILVDDMGGHSSDSNDVASSEQPVADNFKQQTPTSLRHQQDDQGYKLKRLSFTLATTSISDLTFPYVDYDNEIFPFISNITTKGKSDDVNNTFESTDNTSFHKPESQHGQPKEGSSSRHSSFGSVYSFRSLDAGQIKSGKDKYVSSSIHRPCYNTDVKDTPLPYDAHVGSDSSDSDGSASGDTTFYYTASSDTSFITTDGDPLSRQHLSGATHRLPTLSPSEQKKSLHTTPPQGQTPPRQSSQSQRNSMMSSQDRWSPKLPTNGRKSPKLSSLDQRSPRLSAQGQTSTGLPDQGQRQEPCSNNRQERGPNADSFHHKINSLTPSEPPSSPINNVPPRHSSGLGVCAADIQLHVNRNNSLTTSNLSRNPEKTERSINDVIGNHSNYSTEHVHVRHSNCSPRHLTCQIMTSTETDSPAGIDQSFTSSLASSSSFCSLNSSGQDIAWEETPRFPPSLGKPRRKLYAGFDSQPLPMDSFISDSSSMHSVETCGSWGASRSAEVGSCSRTFNMSPNIRAVSSIVSSTYAPVRCMSQEEMLDLLKYTDKMLSTDEHSRNIYLDNRFKDNSYDKTFSSESLESLRSDDTIVDVDQQLTSDHTLDYTKSCVDIKSGDGGMYNNARVCGHQKMNERRQLDKLNNSSGLDFGSKLSNNTFVSGNVVKSKNQLKTVKSKKHSQAFCMRRQSSLDHFTVADGSVSVILSDSGQWYISM